MSISKQFIKLLKDGDKKGLIPFLKSCSTTEKDTLRTTIKKLRSDLKKYYNGTSEIPLKELTQLILLSPKAEEVLDIASFVCMKSYDEIRRAEVILPLEVLESTLLPWYQPSWLNRYFLEIVDFYFDYQSMLRFMEKGWFEPTKEFIAENAAYGLLHSNEKLQEHIWYLFEYYTTIGNDDKWINRFQKLTKNEELDRVRVLKEALLTSNRGFNKPFTGWFCKLFTALEPNDEELLLVQNELFLSLTSPHSKPVSDGLKQLKKIAKHPDFKLNIFLDTVPLLLTWNTKSIINSTLSLLDALMKTYPKRKEELGLLVVQTLAQEDETLQLKAVKLLAKHKLLTMPTILNEIDTYANGLYHTTKELLPNLKEELIQEEIEIVTTQHIREDNHIVYPETFDEMVFFFSAVLLSDNINAVDIFLDSLPKLNALVTNENVEKLEPIFYNAFKAYYYRSFTETTKGKTGYIFAFYLAKYGLILSKKFSNAQYIDKIYNEARTTKSKSEFLAVSDAPIEEEENAITQNREGGLFIICHLMRLMIERLQKGIELELLSKPTHSPAYLDPQILKNKIEQYNTLNISIDSIDLELAQERVMSKEALDSQDELSFEVVSKSYKKEIHPLSFSLKTTANNEGLNKYFSIKNLQIMDSVDVQRIMCLIPNSIHLFLSSTLQTCLIYSTFSDQRLVSSFASETGNKELLHESLNTLLKLKFVQHEINYLFIATSMLYSDQTSRSLSAELWIKATQENSMKQQLLGETLGKLEHNEYAPLKRFTDLVVANMLNLSILHNKGLHMLLSTMISQMNDKPIKGTKKLLEIYFEVMSLTKLSVPRETLEKLELWGEVKSLAGVVKKLRKM